MTGMPLYIGWSEIAVRLGASVVAGVLIGYNRTEYGKAAGLRTTLLVCLAAAIAMIQVNLLLPTADRPANSFIMNDLMRLPLGILTGVGFIAAGAIARRNNLVVGVTTGATLWYVTVVGLCFGGGQIALGSAATALGLLALWALQWIELRLRREHRMSVRIELERTSLNEEKLRVILEDAGLRVIGTRAMLSSAGEHREIAFELLEFRLPSETRVPKVCETLAHKVGVAKIEWNARV
jgi:putative Mg2+ transporter-C (MgtC) family protein